MPIIGDIIDREREKKMYQQKNKQANKGKEKGLPDKIKTEGKKNVQTGVNQAKPDRDLRL